MFSVVFFWLLSRGVACGCPFVSSILGNARQPRTPHKEERSFCDATLRVTLTCWSDSSTGRCLYFSPLPTVSRERSFPAHSLTCLLLAMSRSLRRGGLSLSRTDSRCPLMCSVRTAPSIYSVRKGRQRKTTAENKHNKVADGGLLFSEPSLRVDNIGLVHIGPQTVGTFLTCRGYFLYKLSTAHVIHHKLRESLP